MLKVDKNQCRSVIIKNLTNKSNVIDIHFQKTEELLSVIGKCKIFSTIALYNAYVQVLIEEKRQDFLVTNTPKGLFKYNATFWSHHHQHFF